MKKGIKYAAISGSLGQVVDRFMGCGYKEDVQFEDVIEGLHVLGLIDAVELCHVPYGTASNSDEVNCILKKYGFIPSYVNTHLFNEKQWMNGSLSNADSGIREAAIKAAQKTLDFAGKVGADGINLWLGQDGFDYPFQTDYRKQWNDLVESVRILADYKPSLRITLESKAREPRNRSLVDTVSTALLMSMEADRANVGIVIDIGHVLQCGQNIAQNVEVADKYGKLFNLHVNDNYGSWDDDMIVGSVRLIEMLEFFYVLKKIDYDGYLAVDIFPFRENQFEAIRESVLFMKKMEGYVTSIGLDSFFETIKKGDACNMVKMIRENVLK